MQSKACRSSAKVLVIICSLVLCASSLAQYSQAVDNRSYNLGIVGAFSEVVRLGVKKLALSEVMQPGDMDAFYADAKVVTDRNGVQLYREADLLVSDLYPADVALGLHVLLIYTGDTLDRYLALKADKSRLVNSGAYTGRARREIAVRFGQLLSYPMPVIEELIGTQQK